MCTIFCFGEPSSGPCLHDSVPIVRRNLLAAEYQHIREQRTQQHFDFATFAAVQFEDGLPSHPPGDPGQLQRNSGGSLVRGQLNFPRGSALSAEEPLAGVPYLELQCYRNQK